MRQLFWAAMDWNDGLGAIVGVVALCLVLIGGLLFAYWEAWPKDAKDNPLPCTHYTTIYVPEKIGNSTYIMPVQSCDAWASPSLQ